MDNSSPGGSKPEPEEDNSSNESKDPTPGPSRENKETDSNVKFHPYRKPKSKEPDKDNTPIVDPIEAAVWLKFLADIHEPESEATVANNDVETANVSDAETTNNSATDGSLHQLFLNDLDSQLSDSSIASSDCTSLTYSPSSSSNSSSERTYPKAEIPDFLLVPMPKHTWSVIPEIRKREIGYSNRLNGHKTFQDKMHGSLHSVQRLELMYKLEKHEGCVNGLNFHISGKLLASCSDDLRVCIWDWAAGKLKANLKTRHKSNIFQAKFLPLDDHLHIATCGRDGAVCLMEVDQSGSLRGTRRLGVHRRPAHKISTVAGSPHCFMSCAEDGMVRHYDIRQTESSKLLVLKNDEKPIEIYSVSCNPTDQHEFMLGGHDIFLRLYDRRNLLKPLYKLTPSHFVSGDREYETFITSAVYSYDGTQLLASYKSDDIYLWDKKDMTNNDAVHRYKGHRNNATIKGVNFFGPRSEYIVSGSDCGNIYFWDRECEAIVMWMAGDESGVVNCLEPHPFVPVLATSGLDHDTKIWIPSSEAEPVFTGLVKTVKSNIRQRRNERYELGIGVDNNARLLWMLRGVLHPDEDNDINVPNFMEY